MGVAGDWRALVADASAGDGMERVGNVWRVRPGKAQEDVVEVRSL